MYSTFQFKELSCRQCSLKLPNDCQKIQYSDFECYFTTSQCSYITAQINVNSGTRIFKYFKKNQSDYHICGRCLPKTETKEQCRALDLALMGKGVIGIASSLFTSKLGKISTNILRFTSFHKTRLSAQPDCKVITTMRNDFWEEWELEKIDLNKFYIKSVAHGYYLFAAPEGFVTMSKNKKGWETWERINHGRYNCWKSCHGTYLSARQNGIVEVVPNAKQWERWT